MKLSQEQSYIIDLSKTSPKLSVKAFAGCGKTSTLIEIAKANPDKVYLLLVFSKELQRETEAKLKKLGIKNIIPKTTHSLAYSVVFANKHKVRNKDYKAYDLMDRYKITLGSSYLVLKVVNEYFNNDDSSYTILLNKYKYIDNRITSSIIKSANRFVQDMRQNKLDITHSFYLKEYQLKVVNEGVSYKKYDGVMLDEAQDTNVVTSSIFDNINVSNKIKCGDEHQNIFSWRKTVNLLSKENTKDWDIGYLTTSYRTPKYLAKYSDNFLKVFKGKQETFKGAKEDNEIVRTKNDTYAIITRTNSGMIKYMMNLKEKKQKFKTVRPPKEIFSHVMDISNLANNQIDRVKNESFLKLPSMLSDYNKEHPNSNKSLFGYILDELEDIDRDAYSAVNMINRYGMKELYEIRKLALSY